MTFTIETLLRGDNEAVTERAHHEAEPAHWGRGDVEAVLKKILLAIDRARDPATPGRYVALRGFSWIVEPAAGGVVIAIEIPSGAAVAGPFDIPQARLDHLIASVLSPSPVASSSRPTIH